MRRLLVLSLVSVVTLSASASQAGWYNPVIVPWPTPPTFSPPVTAPVDLTPVPLADPWAEPVVRALVASGALEPVDVNEGDLFLLLYVVKQPIRDLHFQAVFQKSKGASDVRKVAQWISGTLFAVSAPCITPYVLDRTLQYRRDDEDREHTPWCSQLIRDWTGSEDLAARLDRFIGETVDDLNLQMRSVSARSTSQRFLAMTIGSKEGTIVSRSGEVTVTLDVAPRIVQNRTMVPVGYLRQVGFELSYEAPVVTITQPDTDEQVRFEIGSSEYVNRQGITMPLEVAPFIEADRAMVPVRAAFGEFCTVDYQVHRRRVMVTC